jgi:hypothetical protein
MENVFVNSVYNNGLITKIYKECKSVKTISNPIKDGQYTFSN